MRGLITPPARGYPVMATKKTESPQADGIDLRACGGVGRTETIASGNRRLFVAPLRPGRSESRGPLPPPRFELPGSNGRYRRHEAARLQETRPLALAGK